MGERATTLGAPGAGKSYVYSDRGEVALKGFEDPVKLWELRWQE